MKLFWLLFSAGENALGGIYVNIFRLPTIVLIIGLTILYKRRKGIALEVNKETFWMKNENRLTTAIEMRRAVEPINGREEAAKRLCYRVA